MPSAASYKDYGDTATPLDVRVQLRKYTMSRYRSSIAEKGNRQIHLLILLAGADENIAVRAEKQEALLLFFFAFPRRGCTADNQYSGCVGLKRSRWIILSSSDGDSCVILSFVAV
jgi:hypothetical protein